MSNSYVDAVERLKVMMGLPADLSSTVDLIKTIVTSLRGEDGKPASREVAMAVTKLQEAGFWLNEAITLEAQNATCPKCGEKEGHKSWCPLLGFQDKVTP